MRVLIVEDNVFNAFCLTRLFAAAKPDAHVTVVHDSHAALQQLESTSMDLIVLDGDLAPGDGHYCNGPVLADLIWRKFPHSTLVAWTDNAVMRKGFEDVFAQHHKPFTSFFCWKKAISPKQLLQTLMDLDIENEAVLPPNSMRFIPVLANSERHF